MSTDTPYQFNLPAAAASSLEDEITSHEPQSDLDLLRADLPELKVQDTRLPVPGREKYEVAFRTNIDEPELEGWRKRCKSKQHTDGIDGIKLGKLLLANTCVGIYRDGKQLLDSEGDPLKFAHQEFLSLLGTPSAAEAVKGFYQLDSSISSVSQAVMRAAGWGDELDPLDR